METILLKSLIAAAATTVALAAAAAPAHAQVRPYGQFNGWTVEFVPADPGKRTRAQCRATKIFGQENALRVVFGDRLSAFEFMGDGSQARGNRFDVVHWLDRRDPGTVQRAAAQLVTDNEGVEWMRIRDSNDEPGTTNDNLGRARVLTIVAAQGGGEWRYPLDGAKPALERAIDCLNERIFAQAPAAPPPPPPQAQAAPPAPPPPAQPSARQADCLMTIRGRNFIDGRCQFESDPDGSFRVFGEKHFAYVNIMSRGVAEASWNGSPPTQHAQEPLGEVRRNGACWDSQTVRICAWGLGERPQRLPAPVVQAPPPPPVVQAPPPPPPAARRPAPGRSFYAKAEGADVPSLCVDISGGQIREGTPITLWQCHQQAPQRFGVIAATSRVFVEAAQNLCVDGNDKQQLRLANCESIGRNWRYDARSNTIRSNDGLCWDIAGGNIPANIKSRQPVIAWRCHNGINQQFVLNN